MRQILSTPCRFTAMALSLLVLNITPLSAQEVSPARSNYKDDHPVLPRHNGPSTNLTGMLGLNTTPTARMDPVGTVRAGLGASDVHLNMFMGFQLAEPLYVSLRQTGRISTITHAAEKLYPGIDLKLRLFKETETRPALAVGFDSAFGHKHMGSEYLTLSKRFNNFDISGGVAWGRLGNAGHIKNPLRAVSSHFDQRRDFNSDQPQNVDDWFTGEDIGFFGGVEYFTPLKGLSIKADYGVNDHVGNPASDGPLPWSLMVNYQPWRQLDLSAGVIGGDTVMARLSLQDKIYNWPGRYSSPEKDMPEAYAEPSDDMERTLAEINLSPHFSTGRQIGYATRMAVSQTDDQINTITLPLRHKGLKGPTLNFIRHDVKTAALDNHGSPEEIWQDMTIDKNIDHGFSWDGIKKSWQDNQNYSYDFRFILDNKIGLSEEDSGVLFRNAFLVEGDIQWPFGITMGARGRINLLQNLDHLQYVRRPSYQKIRSDEDRFAKQRFSLDRFYTSLLKSLSSNTHVSLTAGYLEEMFGGFGGEILYRPFGKTFAIGAEGWHVYKRNPNTILNKGIFTDTTNTGHLNFFYEMPDTEMTAYAKVGQYLAEDVGLTLGLVNQFENGTKLEGFLTGTNQADADNFGGTTHLYGGVRFTLPLGNSRLVPMGSEIRVTTEPFARDAGQILDHPLPLYDVTEPISYRQLRQSWNEILD